MKSYEQYLRDSAVSKEVIDVFLDENKPSWAQFDVELGYKLGNSLPNDGLDGCSTISTVQKNEARKSYMYINRPCRINTYGDSFTQCHQVSDGETWQEYLAAHLGEPVRNFGMGGYGTYQAYRRMVRTEQTNDNAKYILLYIWGDDHNRSIMRCRHAAIYPYWNHRGGIAFHNNFWANIEMDIDSGKFVEKDNLLPTPQSLYKMTDPDFMLEALNDDLMLKLYAAEHVNPVTLDIKKLNTLAEILGVEAIKKDSPKNFRKSTEKIKNEYGFAATKLIINKAVDFCKANNKELMIILLCPNVTNQLLNNKPRYDQQIVDYLDDKKLRYFDMNLVHLEDYKSFNLSVVDYIKRYYIGHYSPIGNHFFAYSIKNRIVEWLDPKPITYQTNNSQVTNFESYLFNSAE